MGKVRFTEEFKIEAIKQDKDIKRATRLNSVVFSTELLTLYAQAQSILFFKTLRWEVLVHTLMLPKVLWPAS